MSASPQNPDLQAHWDYFIALDEDLWTLRRYIASVEYSNDFDKMCKALNIVGDSWARMHEGYASRWQKNEELRWFTTKLSW
jgi:hypothetical protein